MCHAYLTHVPCTCHTHTHPSQVPRFPSKMSELAKDFITKALDKDPLERPTILEMLNHKWIKVRGEGV